MNRAACCFPFLLMLAACGGAPPVIDAKRVETVDGNRLQITSGTNSVGRFVSVENVDKRWAGKFKGGREKWAARKSLLDETYGEEINRICGEWFYQTVLPAQYHMIDKDEGMGGLAMLSMGAAMAAHMAAYSSTEDANVPVSVYLEFRCRKDKE